MRVRTWALGAGIACGWAIASPALAQGEIRIEPATPPPAPRAPAPPRPAPSPAPPALATGFGRLGVVTEGAPLLPLPDPRFRPLAHLSPGTYVTVQGEGSGCYAVLLSNGTVGYLPARSVQLYPYQVTQVRPAFPVEPTLVPSPPAPSHPPHVQTVLTEAIQRLGVPYRWGGNDETGLDCSGFVKRCFGIAGIPLPRTAREQALVGTPVPLDALQPGDRLYFQFKREYIDHTGIYLGDGRFIHASSAQGQVVIEELSKHARALVGARR